MIVRVLTACVSKKNERILVGIEDFTKTIVTVRIDVPEDFFRYNRGKYVSLQERYVGETEYMFTSEDTDPEIVSEPDGSPGLLECLTLKAMSPLSINNRSDRGNVVAVSEVHSLKKTNESIDLVVSFVGIGDQRYQIRLYDEKWVEYWKEHREEFYLCQNEELERLNELKTLFLVTANNGEQLGKVITCIGMVEFNGEIS